MLAHQSKYKRICWHSEAKYKSVKTDYETKDDLYKKQAGILQANYKKINLVSMWFLLPSNIVI